MEKDWVSIYSTNKLYQAEMVKQMLEDNNIFSVIMNQKDSSYLIGSIELYVEQKHEEKAKELIKQFEN